MRADPMREIVSNDLFLGCAFIVNNRTSRVCRLIVSMHILNMLMCILITVALP